MPRSKAQAGFGAQFALRAVGATTPHVRVAEVVSIQPPGQTRDTIDVTHLDSDDAVKEFIGSLTEGGEASITINFVPEEAETLQTAFTADGGAGEFRILFPKKTHAMTFAGIVTAYEPGEIVVDDKLTATFTVKCSGRPVIAAVQPVGGA